MPRLRDGGSAVRFQASGRAVVSAGPNLEQARTQLVAGKFGTPAVTLQLASPHGEPALALYAAAHVQSGSPPSPDVKYQIEVSTDDGRTWKPAVKDWTIPRRGDEPKDFWSQSLCWGSLPLGADGPAAVRVRFRNDDGKSYARCEAHLVYRTGDADGTKVTFAWAEDGGSHQASHTFAAASRPEEEAAAWTVPAGRDVQTRWVEFEPAPAR
jgi:hypothetical protein